MLIYVEGFADNKYDERVGNVCLSVLGFSRSKHCQTVLASAKKDLCTENHKINVSPLPNRVKGLISLDDIFFLQNSIIFLVDSMYMKIVRP